MKAHEIRLKKNFKEHMILTTLKNAPLIIILAIIFISYYMYSDLMIRESLDAFYFRCIPQVIGIPLLLLLFITPKQYNYLKFVWYHLFLVSGVVMMFGITLVHLDTQALAPSVTGTILIFFVFSLEVRTHTTYTALIYFLSTLLFTFILFFFFNPSREQFTILADIYPIIIIGFIINRVQYKLRFKLFKTNYLLDVEKQKTEELYQETLIINKDLKQKAEEITAHKEEIEEKNTILEENNATKDKFLTIISHDLISPFNTLIGFSNLLVESFESKEGIQEQKKYVEYIHQNINRIYRLVENLLLWARSQKNALEYNRSDENLFLVTREIMDVLQPSAEKKSITLHNKINKETSIRADRNMLSTILRNLISNAIKFTPEGGKVTLSARPVKEDNRESYIRISVKDTGRGMSPEMKDKLFCLSKSISTKGTANEEGTGLGLILCKEFIDKHQGSISIESELGKGSNFVVTLPA
jgi:signal transduction histidine kinase